MDTNKPDRRFRTTAIVAGVVGLMAGVYLLYTFNSTPSNQQSAAAGKNGPSSTPLNRQPEGPCQAQSTQPEEGATSQITNILDTLPPSTLSAEQTEAKLRVPPHRWYQERRMNMAKESLEECVNHLGNNDDQHLAETSLGGDMIAGPEDGTSQVIVVTRLARVRRLLAVGRENPEEVIPLVRRKLEEIIPDWPSASAELKARMRTEMFPLLSESDRCMRYHAQATAGTYLLGELDDHASLPLLLRIYHLHDGAPHVRGPVPAAVTLNAMHRLVTGYPEQALSEQARQARDEYLRSISGLLPPPRQETVVCSWKSDNDESDPRIAIADPKRHVLADQQTMTINIYSASYTEGEADDRFGISKLITDPWNRIPERTQQLFQKLERFVTAVQEGK